MKIYIKYMVSLRCKLAVKAELEKLSIPFGTIELGEVAVTDSLTEKQHDALKRGLLKSGLELMDDKKAQVIEKIKTIVIEMVHYSE